MLTDLKHMNKQINYHLAHLPRHFKPNSQDEEDLRQEIICEILVKTARYDSSMSSAATYSDRIIRNHLEGFKSSKRWRKHQTPESIHDIEEEDEPVTNEVSSYDLDEVQQHVFATEVRDMIAELPEHLQRSCELLKVRSLKETAQILGVSPSAIHRMIQEIKKSFEESGFDSQI